MEKYGIHATPFHKIAMDHQQTSVFHIDDLLVHISIFLVQILMGNISVLLLKWHTLVDLRRQWVLDLCWWNLLSSLLYPCSGIVILVYYPFRWSTASKNVFQEHNQSYYMSNCSDSLKTMVDFWIKWLQPCDFPVKFSLK